MGGDTERTRMGPCRHPVPLRRASHTGQPGLVSAPNGIDRLLSSRFVFHCRETGPNLRDEERAALDVRVSHLGRPPHANEVDWAPPSLRALYERSDGAALFCPVGTSIDHLRADYGLLLHPADGVTTETEQLHDWLLGDLEAVAGELETSDLVATRQRIASFLAIGMRCTGDPIILDRSVTTESGEHPVAILDHELLLEAVYGEIQNAHVDVLALLTAIDQNPHAYLDDAWRYHGQDGRQYYVDSVDVAP